MDEKQIELVKSFVCEPQRDNKESLTEYSNENRLIFKHTKFANTENKSTKCKLNVNSLRVYTNVKNLKAISKREHL